MSEAVTSQAEGPAPIPAPPEFPVVWDHPDDEKLFWNQDRMHFPQQITPLGGDVAVIVSRGFSRAARNYEVPVRFVFRRLNTYLYATTIPDEGTPEEMEEKGKRSEAAMQDAMARMWELWEREWLPEVKGHLQFWESFDLPGASLPAFLGHFDETWRRLERLWEIHHNYAMPGATAWSMFDDIYQDLFEGAGALDAYKLLQGHGNKSVEGDLVLWELSRQAAASPELKRFLLETPAAAVLQEVGDVRGGSDFKEGFLAYLNEYGQRCDRFADVGCPSWIESPVTPINVVKAHLQEGDRDLKGELQALADERDRLIQDAREKLAGYPRAVVDKFEFFLKAATAGSILQEDHNFWIDQRSLYRTRCVFLEAGRRFVSAGVLDAPDDVFLLQRDEVRNALAGTNGRDLRQIVAERQAEMDRFAGVQPPPALGTPPPGPPPENPMTRGMMKFFGAPPEDSGDPMVLSGNAGSSGKVRAKARVVHSLAESGRLARGEILVAPSTMPAWTPLFAIASGIVTDAGGVLSHCAIVAREYHIPAVVGTGRATAVIQDGAEIEVDGDGGRVRLL